ncbi:hypothetical protein HMPREF3089_04515 [Klebsiella sp. HMSC22F09]|nr:hypothetical protein HMPREF3089_04515 [Klebsiella sp. HMSC22F09]
MVKPDWKAIETAYRAGVMFLREMQTTRYQRRRYPLSWSQTAILDNLTLRQGIYLNFIRLSELGQFN